MVDELQSLKQLFEYSLRQIAKLQRLKFGDDNTTFFNHSIKHRIRCNKINVVFEDGREITDPVAIQQKFFRFYSKLFGTVLLERTSIDVGIVQQGHNLSHQQGLLLDLTFSPEEIKAAL